MGSNTASRCFTRPVSPLLRVGLAVALLAIGCAQESSQETSRQDTPTTQASSTTQARLQETSRQDASTTQASSTTQARLQETSRQDASTTQATSTTQARLIEPAVDVCSAEESASVSSDIFVGSVSLTDAAGVEFGPVFSVYKPVREPVISSVASGDGDYVLELRDASGMAIRSVPFNALTVTGDGLLDDGTRFSTLDDVFEFVVSDPPVYESFAVMRDGVELGSVSRSQNAPSISISGPSWDMFNDDGTISVSWVGSDADGDDLVYHLYYSTNGGSFYKKMFSMTEATSKSFSATRLRGSSRARIGVSVSDGARSVFAETPVFSVAGHAPPC